MANRPVNIIQLSDPHLFEKPAKDLLGLKTDASFREVLKTAKANHWPPDLVLTTGDLSQDESEGSYQRVKRYMDELDVPIYCLPGNHDNSSVMSRVLPGSNIHLDRRLILEGWQIIMLDSTAPRSAKGHLGDGELAFLEWSLSDRPDLHALVCMHHNPVPSGSRWLDTMMIDNHQRLFELLYRYENMRGVLWGHIHQEFYQERNKIKLVGSPSTCFQFKPRCDDFSLDGLYPGYRWLRLEANGDIETAIDRASGFELTLDLTAKGY